MDRGSLPRVVLMCHEGDRIDTEGLARWLASTMELVGVIHLRDQRTALMHKVRREIRRVGLLRFLDVVAFRIYYRARLARSDARWVDEQVSRLVRRFPINASEKPILVAGDPNAPAVQRFLRHLRPDFLIARCKHILKPEVFNIPTLGTYALHPGICPEYRNAHGCFWALAHRDLKRVGMTLLRVDEGVDTGPIFLQAGCRFDEIRESPVVIQYKVVLENLDAITGALVAAWRGKVRPMSVNGRRSAIWGQPWFSAYLRWKRAARRQETAR